MAPQERTIQPTSPATPLSNAMLNLMMQQLTGGGGGAGGRGGPGAGVGRFPMTGDPRGPSGLEAVIGDIVGRSGLAEGAGGGPGGAFPGPEFGLGLTPLQREAGTAARQFVAGGGGAFDVSPLLKQLEEIQRRRVGETTADIREGFGIAGSRFGTPVAVGQARAAGELETQFGAQVGELLRQEFANQQQRMLQGISLLQNIGTANLEPFLRFAGMGIMPEQTVFEQNPLVTGLETVGGLAGGVLPFI